MFEMVLSDISSGKTYPGIDAKVSLTVDNDTIIEDREFSIYKAIDNILKRIENPKWLERSEPIFICSCGEVGCDYYDFRFKIEDNFVEAEMYTRPDSIFSSVRSRRIGCRNDKAEFLQSILRMISKYISAIWNEEIHIDMNNKDQIMVRIKADDSQSMKCLTQNLVALKGVVDALKEKKLVRK